MAQPVLQKHSECHVFFKGSKTCDRGRSGQAGGHGDNTGHAHGRLLFQLQVSRGLSIHVWMGLIHQESRALAKASHNKWADGFNPPFEAPVVEGKSPEAMTVCYLADGNVPRVARSLHPRSFHRFAPTDACKKPSLLSLLIMLLKIRCLQPTRRGKYSASPHCSRDCSRDRSSATARPKRPKTSQRSPCVLCSAAETGRNCLVVDAAELGEALRSPPEVLSAVVEASARKRRDLCFRWSGGAGGWELQTEVLGRRDSCRF